MKVSIPKTSNQSVLAYLREEGIFVNAPCGGKGKCGKCKVKVIEAGNQLNKQCEVRLTQDKEERYQLACKLSCVEGMMIEVEPQKEGFEVVTDFMTFEKKAQVEDLSQETRLPSYSIAVDIGTTTVAFALVDTGKGKQIIDTYTMLNSGKTCGADVISRIDYVNTKGGRLLQELMQHDLNEGITGLCEKNDLSLSEIKRVVIAGNTTMLHLLTGASCEHLGVYPFTPEFIDEKHLRLAELLENDTYQAEAILLPGISTYVGADIVSGIMQCKMHQSEAVSLLIDIGTNGEMVVGNKHKLLGLATAAGPAFEGGNISCGTGSVPGAICKVSADESGEVIVETIGQEAPIGICGSGLIDAVAEALKKEWIDETGMIEWDEAYIPLLKENKEITLTQKDIRQFQLAKAAIRAGIEILTESYGITHSQIENIYLAGGFGKFINIDHAIVIGLLPRCYRKKIKRIGNASLGGAIEYLSKTHEEDLKHIKQIARELNLANEPKFNDYFIEYMLFEEE